MWTHEGSSTNDFARDQHKLFGTERSSLVDVEDQGRNSWFFDVFSGFTRKKEKLDRGSERVKAIGTESEVDGFDVTENPLAHRKVVRDTELTVDAAGIEMSTKVVGLGKR